MLDALKMVSLEGSEDDSTCSSNNDGLKYQVEKRAHDWPMPLAASATSQNENNPRIISKSSSKKTIDSIDIGYNVITKNVLPKKV